MIFNCLKRKRVRIVSVQDNGFESLNQLVKDMSSLAKMSRENPKELIQQHISLISKVNKETEKALLRADDDKYLMSSFFLHECFSYLNRQEEESLHLVTGPESGKLNILSVIIPLTLKVQSIVEAEADPDELRLALRRMDKLKYHFLGYFHIHPGMGESATYPSGIDLKLQHKVERGYKAIGAIFSRDGFFRFHATKIPEIEIYGGGVEKINETLYRLSEIS